MGCYCIMCGCQMSMQTIKFSPHIYAFRQIFTPRFIEHFMDKCCLVSCHLMSREKDGLHKCLGGKWPFIHLLVVHEEGTGETLNFYSICLDYICFKNIGKNCLFRIISTWAWIQFSPPLDIIQNHKCKRQRFKIWYQYWKSFFVNGKSNRDYILTLI